MRHKIISLIMAAVLLATIVTGCGKNEVDVRNAAAGEYTINTESLFPVINEPGAVTLDIAVNLDAAAGEPEEMWFYQWLEEKSQVNINWIGIINSSWNERKSVAMASGELADIYIGFPWTTDEIVEYGMNQEYFLPLNSYIEQYGDEITYIFDYMADADMEQTATCPDGNIYALPKMGEAGKDMLSRTTYGMAVNTEWLDKLGLEVPETMDELYEVLTAFKNEDPDGDGQQNELPLSAEYNAEFRSLMLGAYGFVTPGTTAGESNLQLGVSGDSGSVALKKADDGSMKPVYIPLDPDYKEYLTMMNKFYTEGLLDPEFFTIESVDRAAKNMEGKTGAIVGSLEVTLGNNPDLFKNYQCFLVTDEKGKPPVTYQVPMVGIGQAVVTSACEYPDVAVRLLNAFYDPTTMIYNWNGPEISDEDNYNDLAKDMGVGFEVAYDEDGTFKTYTYPNMDKNKYATDGEYLGALVRSGAAGNFINGIYARVIKYNADPKKVDLETPMGWFRASQQENNLPYIERGFPLVYFDSQTATRAKELKTQLEDYIYQMEAQFINGSKSIEKDYDGFINELKNLGADEFLQLYTDAYEDYQALAR